MIDALRARPMDSCPGSQGVIQRLGSQMTPDSLDRKLSKKQATIRSSAYPG